mgnify:FL=1
MKRIIGYVNTADLNDMREEDVRALTVINIAFGLIRDGEVVWDAKDARDGMVSIRKSNPELKIVLSVGGWGADGFSQAARTKEGRERFAASALAIVKEYGLDGIDIDWEYPGTSLAGIASDRSDKENYTLLLAELRKTLDAYREGMLVTTAVGGDVYFALQTDMNLPASEILSTYVYRIGLLNGDYGYSTAVGLFNSVINVILLIFVNWVVKKLNDGEGL